MSAFFELLVQPVNMALGILLGALILYWLFVIVGALDIDTFDFDFGVDGDAAVDFDPDLAMDADLDVDADVAGGDFSPAHHGHSVGESIGATSLLISGLRFFNFGEVPFMLLFSVLILSMWGVSMLATALMGGLGQLAALLMLIPNLILSLFVVKLLTTPLKGISGGVDERAAKYRNLTGKRCVICSGSVTDSFGQAEIMTDGAPLRLNVVAVSGEALAQGDEAVIVEYDKARHVYRVAKFNLEGLA